MNLKVAIVCLLLVVAVEVPGQGFVFKRNSLGETLQDFRRINAGPDQLMWTKVKEGRKWKDARISVATPFCSDRVTGFPELEDNNAPADEVRCTLTYATDDPLGIGPVQAGQILYRFYNGVLFRIDIEFRACQYETLVKAFEAKYGEPASRSVVSNQNKFGARLDSGSVMWRSGPDELAALEGVGNGPGYSPCEVAATASFSRRDAGPSVKGTAKDNF